jgi:glucose-6-phosphate isomerase
MPHLSLSAARDALLAHARTLRSVHLRQLFAADPERFTRFSLAHAGLLLDFSKQRLDATALDRLHDLAVASDVAGALAAMLDGRPVNPTEGRAALHMALRAPEDFPLPRQGAPVNAEIADQRARLAALCATLHEGRWRGFSGERINTVVNLGIGGSDLGPRMATRALAAYAHPDVAVHFVANVDGADLGALLARLDPRRTLFIIASKSFTTEETLTNADTARTWLEAHAGDPAAVLARHFIAVTARPELARNFGVAAEHILAFRDDVGGRFSLCSPVGLALALAIGFPHFAALLAGAHAMDRHFIEAPPRANLPLTLALIDLWNVLGLGIDTRGVFPYSQSLELLPAHLQQLEMESLGKCVDRDGAPLATPPCPLVWGGAGTPVQHSFFQFLHQGGRPMASEFLLVQTADFPLPGHHKRLLANALAQSAALAFGQDAEVARAAGAPAELLPYLDFPGNQPSTTVLIDTLSPERLGQLLALYEHKVFCLGALHRLNVFDQWGVELGKKIARRLEPCLDGAAPPADLDASTRGLLAALGAKA